MTEANQSQRWGAYYEQLKDRPPRKSLVRALDLVGAPPADATAVDLGCGNGRDVVELLRRGWNVVAVDAEPEALKQLAERHLPNGDRITPVLSRFEDVPLPIGCLLVNSSFAMPLCEPQKFHELWQRIRDALPAGGRFSGQWYGPRDSWLGRPGMTFVSREEAERLLHGFEPELFEEEESDGKTPRGKPHHWHIFHIVARKLAQ